MNSKVIELIGKMGLIPVIALDDVNDAIPTAHSILKGGLDLIEITMRTDAAIQSIKEVKSEFPNMLVGAGTVLSIEKAKEAVDSGAEFIVSPGFDYDLVNWCIKNNIAVTPGCVTPTEIGKALELGINVMKFFPASVYGGVNALKALNGPFKNVRFIPTGGISLKNLSDYSDKDYVQAIGGGWLCGKNDIRSQNYDNISNTVAESIKALLGFELAHLGMHARNSDEALSIAKNYSKIFGFKVKEGNSSVFSGDGLEVIKKPSKEVSGHIAVRTNNIERAIYYLEKKEYFIEPSTAKERNGKVVAVYLKDRLGKFAIHLLQK